MGDVAPELLTIRITTGRLILRSVTMSDAQPIFDAFTPTITRYMGVVAPTQIDDTRRFLTETIQRMSRGEELVCAITDRETNVVLGCVGAHHLRDAIPELGVWLRQSSHGCGLGAEAITGTLAWASERTPADVFLYPVDRDNTASREIAEGLGGVVVAEHDKRTADGRDLHILDYHIPRRG